MTVGYCMSPASLRSICAQIRVETTLHTLVRSEPLIFLSFSVFVCVIYFKITRSNVVVTFRLIKTFSVIFSVKQFCVNVLQVLTCKVK